MAAAVAGGAAVGGGGVGVIDAVLLLRRRMKTMIMMMPMTKTMPMTANNDSVGDDDHIDKDGDGDDDHNDKDNDGDDDHNDDDDDAAVAPKDCPGMACRATKCACSCMSVPLQSHPSNAVQLRSRCHTLPNPWPAPALSGHRAPHSGCSCWMRVWN